MRLTRRIALLTGLGICRSARPLPRDRTKAGAGEAEDDTMESPANLPQAEAPPSRIG